MTVKTSNILYKSIRQEVEKELRDAKIAARNVLEDLETEKQKLVRIDRAKSEFVSLAAHQLRTPLTTVNWYSEMLLQTAIGDDPKKRKEYLEKIHKGSERMVVLINMFLNVSRIELGTLVVELKPVHITEILLDIINEQKLQIAEKNIIISNHFSDSPPTLLTDQGLLRMVFQNLLSNAIKYTPIKGHIDISISKEGKDNLLVIFADTGYGIPKKDQDRIFTKMFRADNIKEKVIEGTGLGLYIVKEVLRNLGGSIRFISEEDMGTTFYVTLPFNKALNK